jgi:hypothetical protein
VRTDRPCPWLSVAEAARRKGVARGTVWAWIKNGLIPRGGGERVKLRTKRVGARRKTRRRWLEDFQARLDGTPAGADRPPRGRRPSAALEEQRRLAERLGVPLP